MLPLKQLPTLKVLV